MMETRRTSVRWPESIQVSSLIVNSVRRMNSEWAPVTERCHLHSHSAAVAVAARHKQLDKKVNPFTTWPGSLTHI